MDKVLVDAMTEWRRAFHRAPELAFRENHTAASVARALRSFGVEVEEGLAGTGVVGTLRRGGGTKAIGFRADMDALPIAEKGECAHKSQHEGVMHACGHDGHMAMLLGAAKHLSEHGVFSGTVRFIFQPAEEAGGGAKKMVEDGLFVRFPVDAVYAIHNWPALSEGTFACHRGPVMASSDDFEVVLRGRGGHAAMPHETKDPVLAGAHVVAALQSIVSRGVPPSESAVVSVTQFHAGDVNNVIPELAVLRGTVRAFNPETQDTVERCLRAIVEGVSASFGVAAEVTVRRDYPPTVNSIPEVEYVADTLRELVGSDRVRTDLPPSMGAEDFSFMLRACKGAYVWLGTGSTHGLHHPKYDFNDRVLVEGASLWVRMAERYLQG